MIPVSLITGWISSVTYIAALSLWAARVEVTQQAEEADRAEHPIEQRVVEKLVESTTIEAAQS